MITEKATKFSQNLKEKVENIALQVPYGRGFILLGSWETDVLVSATVDDIHDVINISSAVVVDTKILKMLKRAEVAFRALA